MRSIILLLVVVAAQSQDVFVSEEGAFSVLFPHTPRQETLTLPEGAPRHVFHDADEEVTYFVTHRCLPAASLPADLEEVLDSGRDGTLRMVPGVILVSEERMRVSGQRARRLVLVAPGMGTAYALLVLADQGAYYNLLAGAAVPQGEKRAGAFLESFKVLAPTAKAWCQPK